MQMRIESSGGEGSCIHRTRELRILKYVENTRREHRLVSSLCHDLHQRYPARDSRNFLTALRRLTFVRGPSPPPPPPAFPYTHILVFLSSLPTRQARFSSNSTPTSLHAEIQPFSAPTVAPPPPRFLSQPARGPPPRSAPPAGEGAASSPPLPSPLPRTPGGPRPSPPPPAPRPAHSRRGRHLRPDAPTPPPSRRARLAPLGASGLPRPAPPRARCTVGRRRPH